MSNRSPTPTDTRLYNHVKKEARSKFDNFPSLYASSWIVREYKKRGGEYSGKKPSKKTGISRWYKEQWVQVESYLKTGKKTECGSDIKKTKACRPLKRVDDKTPITISELLKKHDKTTLIKIARQKQNDMKGRVMWKTGRFYPSKGNSPSYGFTPSVLYGSAPRNKNSPAPRKLSKATDSWYTSKPLYKPVVSDSVKKKGMVYVMKDGKKRKIHFGDATMSDYRKHKSKSRRANYLSRSGGIRDGNGRLTANNKNSANYWSRNYLW
jgi:hypothetical protein